jgi:hypothetical protein
MVLWGHVSGTQTLRGTNAFASFLEKKNMAGFNNALASFSTWSKHLFNESGLLRTTSRVVLFFFKKEPKTVALRGFN